MSLCLILTIWKFKFLSHYYYSPNYIPLNEKAANISATILIPCRNPSQQLQFLLKQLDHQLINGENTNVFVIDDFSDKEIVLDPSLKSSLLRLKQHRADLSNTKNNKKEAIALGVELSKHEYIICLDSDVTLSENWWYLVSNFIDVWSSSLHVFKSWIVCLGIRYKFYFATWIVKFLYCLC